MGHPLSAGGLAVDVAQDVSDALKRLRREDANAASYNLGLDTSGPDGVLDAVDGLVQFAGDRPDGQGDITMGPHGSWLPTGAATTRCGIRHVLHSRVASPMSGAPKRFPCAPKRSLCAPETCRDLTPPDGPR